MTLPDTHFSGILAIWRHRRQDCRPERAAFIGQSAATGLPRSDEPEPAHRSGEDETVDLPEEPAEDRRTTAL